MRDDHEVETPVSPEQFAKDCFDDLCQQVLNGTQPEYCDEFETILGQDDTARIFGYIRRMTTGSPDSRTIAAYDLANYAEDCVRDYLRDSEALARYIRGQQ